MSDIQDKSIGEDVGDKIIEDGSLVSAEKSSEAPDNNEESSSIHQLSAETMRSLNEEIARTLDLTGTGTGTATGTATGSTTTATGTTTGTSTTTTTQDETGDLSTQPKRDEVQVGKTVAGECRNILPVLVEHLRSALELTSASTKRIIADEPLAPDPLSCNRNYHYQDPASNSSLPQTHTMDFNFFGDLLVSDIKTALVRLQETLRRVDVDALTRYSSTLESNEKLRLLQLISNLVSNLKMAKLDDVSSVQPQPQQQQQLQVPAASTANSSISSPAKRRQRGKDRHTIGVSSEELARARRWLEERGTGVTLTSQRLSLAPQTVQLDPSPVNPESNLENKLFDSPRACDKHMKDAINQQQSLQSRTKDTEAQVNTVEPSDTKVSSDKLETDTEQVNFININNKVASNKFTAKKFKIKRANTIDIPNYLKLQAEKSQSCSPGLRRPIDIGDRLSWNPPQANVLIPSFEPKTENDRKFLALINRNNDNNNNINNNNSNSNNSYGNNSTSGYNQPFKSFNYRQTSSIADKNWKSRFSNIKTAFDKPSPPASVDGSSRRSSRDDGKNNYREHPGVLVGSLKLGRPESANASIKDYNFGRKVGNFTHAATSPFQKINNIKNIYSEEKPTPSYYLPACASSGMLRAKLKMFDHQQETVSPVTTMHVDPLPRVQLSAAHTKVNVKPEKIIKDTGYSTDALNHCQNKIRNNGFRNLSYDKVRRHTVIYDTNGNDDNNNNNNINRINNNDNDRKAQGQDVQKQSVAVQTNYPIQLNNQHVDNDDHESLIRNICPRPHQQKNYQSVPITFYENENPIYEPPKPVPRDIDFLIPPIINSNYNSNRFLDDESDHSFMDDENIANQDISDDRIVTRYTSAIATVENSPLSPITPASVSPPDYQEDIPCAAIQPVLSDDVQRHNMLQQSLIRRLHYETDKVIKPIQIPSQAPIPIPIPTATVTQNKSMSQNLSFNKNPRYSMIHYDDNLSPITTEVVQNGRESVEPLIESRNTQEKINIFEEKSTRRPDPLVIRPIHIPPKINIVSPSRTMPQGLNSNNNPYVPPLPVKYSSPVDSSDEYLVNCATRPHRSIVLSKSESWHQLALSKNHLQVPPVPPHKPPRVSSCKHLDPEKNDMKKMEEKVQRYFDRSSSSLGQSKRDSGPKRRSLPRKNNLGSLARSHTMPHIYDDVTDVDKAFDSLFEETTRDRH